MTRSPFGSCSLLPPPVGEASIPADVASDLRQEQHDHDGERTPAERFLFAFLERGVRDAVGMDLCGVPRKKMMPRIQREAREWMASDVDEQGSFVWLCHLLSLDPAAVREAVLTKRGDAIARRLLGGRGNGGGRIYFRTRNAAA